MGRLVVKSNRHQERRQVGSGSRTSIAGSSQSSLQSSLHLVYAAARATIVKSTWHQMGGNSCRMAKLRDFAKEAWHSSRSRSMWPAQRIPSERGALWRDGRVFLLPKSGSFRGRQYV